MYSRKKLLQAIEQTAKIEAIAKVQAGQAKKLLKLDLFFINDLMMDKFLFQNFINYAKKRIHLKGHFLMKLKEKHQYFSRKN